MSVKIEAGKYYRLRNGSKCYIGGGYSINPFNSRPPIFIWWGFVSVSSNSYGTEVENWKEDGSYAEISNPDWDIVAEWVDPVTVERDVVLVQYEDNPPHVLLTDPGDPVGGGVSSVLKELSRHRVTFTYQL